MDNNKQSILLVLSSILAAICLLCSCQGKKQSPNYSGLGFPPNARETFPCWFYHPSPSGIIGSIGISRDMSVNRSPEFYARKYALQGLCRYYGGEKSFDRENMSAGVKEILSGKKDQITIQGKSVSIVDTFRTQGYLFTYAASAPGSLQQVMLDPCPDKNTIVPENCEPEWICSPGSEELGGVVGISFRASSPQRQYNLAFKNALALLEYTYGIRVKGKDVVERMKSSGTGNIKMRYSTLGVDKSIDQKEKTIRVYVKELRHSRDMLYLWLVSPELPTYETGQSLKWLRNPGGHSFKGGVGQCGPTSSGLLSDQIDRAAKRAMKSLVRKYADTTVNSTEIVKRGSYSSYYQSGVQTKFDTKLYPRLRGFYVDENKVAYVWVVFKDKRRIN